MAIESNELWSEQRSERCADGTWNLYRGWQVVNVPANASDAAILGASAIDGGSHAIPALNAAHPQNGLSKCAQLPISSGKGPGDRIVRAIYTIPPSGIHGNADPNPLNRP
jgi:hypothetical protein